MYLVPKETTGADGRPKRRKVEGEGEGVGAGAWLVDTEKKVVVSKDGSVKLAVLDRLLIRIQVIQPQPNRPKLSLSFIRAGL